jgi:hypothetical protein
MLNARNREVGGRMEGERRADDHGTCCGAAERPAASSRLRSHKIGARAAHGRNTAYAAALLALFVASRALAGDVSASYDGSLTLKKGHGDGTVAGALNQAGSAVSGSIAVGFADPTMGGVYNVTGVARRKRVVLNGFNSNGVRLQWRARAAKGSVLLGVAKLRGAGKKAKGLLSLRRRTLEPPVTPPTSCDNSFFTGQVMGRVLQPICANCHTAGGAAQATSFRVTAGDPIATQESVSLQIDVAHPDESRLTRKPLNLVPHAGGQQLSPGGDEAKILEQWVSLVATGQQCKAGGGDVPLVPLAPEDLLNRAAMDLLGRHPTTSELDAVESNAAVYDSLVDGYLHSPEFLERVKDVYDDALLVRREDFADESRDETNAIYGEALELIAYIVSHDRPFTEIGTADYTVANELFQRDTNRMPFPMEPVAGMAWRPTHYLDGRPHAGLLSTSAFYEVWDTNNTNKNRRRANRWSIVFHCYNFLDTPVDVTRDVDNNDANSVLNAVTTRPDCKACHDRLDPMASFLFPLDNVSRLEDTSPTSFFSGNPERWRSANKRPPAVYGIPGTDLRDMGRLLTQHPKFAECQTKRAFKMLFLRDPKTTEELQAAADIASHWVKDDHYNFRSLVRRWMTSDVYRGRPASDGAEWVRRASPERLEASVKGLTGFVWTRPAEDDENDGDPNSDPPRTEPVPLLTNEEDGFKIILGGINGVSVSGRSYSLNASVAAVQRKLAALAADWLVTNDLALPNAQRKLLTGVTGDEDPRADEAVLRAQIVRLVRRLHGQEVAADSPQVSILLNLYRALWNDGTQSGTGSNQVPGTSGERAWRGLLVALLRSPHILLY